MFVFVFFFGDYYKSEGLIFVVDNKNPQVKLPYMKRLVRY